MKRGYTDLESLSLVSVHARPIVYNKNQEPNPTGNVSLTLKSERWHVVLVLCVLLSIKKNLIKIRNGAHAKNGKKE